MVRTVDLSGSGLDTTALGLGCATLFRLPSIQARWRILDTAYEAGIRHFDTAPMYGLGRSERELGRFARSRGDDIVVATKFGLAPSPVGRLIGRVQAPARRVLAAVPSLQRRAQTEAATAGSGRLGGFIYEVEGYDAASARRSVERSLRHLRRGHVDLLLLHDPVPGSVRSDDVCAFLEDAVHSGEVRTWGIAGEPGPTFEVAAALPAPVLQLRDDILQPEATRADVVARAGVVFGVLGAAMPTVLAHMRSGAAVERRWTAAIGADCGQSDVLAGLLLRDALTTHTASVVLYSTIRSDHLLSAVREAAAAVDPDPALLAFRALVRAELGRVGESHP